MTEFKKVLWFSRHKLSEDQEADLVRVYGPIKVNQVDKTIQSASELTHEILDSDVVAIVAPIELQGEFLALAGDRPVIFSKSNRVIKKQADGTESKVVFEFAGWYQVKKLVYVTEQL